MNTRLLAKASLIALAAGIALPQAASAQGAVGALRDEILVTATKKANAENVQDVPLAITAYGADQLDAIKVRTLESLTTLMPNVSFDDIATSRGVANFSIRGLGINSSIPSIDPTVGVFADGVYLGINGGVVLDIFDLESIEVLRGPQGILFGRNVTGGAVLINTKRPNLQEFEASFKGAVETGMRGTGNNYYAMGGVSGPLVTDTLAVRLSAYYNNDRGWFENFVPGTGFEDFGKAETYMVRPSLYWTPSDDFSMLVRFEHGESTGDGPAAQNHTNGLGLTNPFTSFPRDSFDFSIDEPGFYDQTWDQLTVESNLDVAFGDGTITNIFGWREYDNDTLGDIDATSLFMFHATSSTDQDQISNEIRYNGRFGAIDVTTGFYYFTQDIAYNEDRFLLFGLALQNGGGVQDQKTWAFFGQFDIDLSDTFTVNLGARYTNEKKDVVISNLNLNRVANCDVRISGDCSEDFADGHTWKNFTPKVGFQWEATDFMNVYGHWTQGVRSGGYNFRNTSIKSIPFFAPGVPNPGFDPLFLPGPFDEETVNAFELGFKAQPGDGRATINAAFYYNDINDMQRELNLADPAAGVVQVITNSADATIFGIEIEGQYAVTDNLLLLGSLGHANGDYDKVIFDIGFPSVSPGVVDASDKALKIPRLAPWTWSAGFVHTLPLGGETTVDTRFNYSHRDAAFYTDNNLGVLNEVEIIDASIGLNLGGNATFSVYGRNLLNESNFGGDTQLPPTIGPFPFGGGTFSPLSKGRIVGIELQLNM